MKPSSLLRAAVVAAATLIGSAAMAQATLSSLHLEFAQPTGTALATDDIPVYLRITNTDSGNAFLLDNALPFGGLNSADVPTMGYYYDPDLGDQVESAFATYNSFSLVTGYGCSGNFTNACDAAAYSYQWNDGPPNQLGAGQSATYLFVTFKPVGGVAPAGTYEFYRSVLFLQVSGEDAAGHALTSFNQVSTTCEFDTAAECLGAGASIFTREVTAVPEPASVFMLSLGLAGMLLMQRRRS